MYDVYWLARWLLIWGSKYLEYNSSVWAENNTEQTNNWIKQSELNKNITEWMKVEQLMNNNRNWQWIQINSDSLNIQNWRLNRDRPTFARNKYLCDYGTDNCNLFAHVLVMRHQMSCCRFLCFSSRLTCGRLKNHRTPQQLCCFIPNTPVQYRLSSIIAMIMSWE